MNAITIPAALREQLLAVHGTIELRDEAGLLVGEFVRKLDLSEFEVLDQPASDEEIQRRLRESPFFTAEQVEERLRRLRKCA